MFWGIAIMLYEQTLVSDQSEFDSLVAASTLTIRPAFVPAGPAIGNCTWNGTVDPNNDGKATDIVFALPAVGAAGYAPASGYCIPNAGDLLAPGMQSRFGGPKVPLQ